jgi:type IX secretion system PorP/SprF family membrane protein
MLVQINRKIFGVLLIGLILVSTGHSQQLPFYGQYLHNPFVYNPSLTGNSGIPSAFLIHRSQWLDIPGQPVTTSLTLDGPIKEKNIALGMNLFADKTDFSERIGVYGSFAYHLKISNNHNIRFGVSLGGLESRVDFAKALVRDSDDPALLQNYEKQTGLDGCFGVAYQWGGFEMGFAIPQILATPIEFSNSASRVYYDLSRHYMVNMQYQILLNEEKNISLTPLVLSRFTPGAPLQYDLNALLSWNDIAWLAVSYRSNYAVGLNARIKVAKRVSIGYTYDVITSTIGTYSGTSHEIMLGYAFGKEDFQDPKLMQEYQDRIDSLEAALSTKEQEIQSRYNELIAKADQLYGEGNYAAALAFYDKAHNLKPAEQYPKDQMAIIQQLLDKKYRDAIWKADSLFKAKEYKKARQLYLEALRHKPDDEYAQDMLNKTDKIIALFDKRYTSLINEGDSLFMNKKYALAKGKYSDALKFYPSARYPKDMISMINNNRTAGDIRMNARRDFLDEFGNPAAKGFYVVMASFKNKDYADRLKKEKGYQSVFNKVREFHYVYVKRFDDYGNAKDLLIKKARKEVADSWIYNLR